MNILLDTRGAIVAIGREMIRQTMPWAFGVGLVRRKAEIGQIRWRFVLIVRLCRKQPVSLMTWPAWRDEPTAIAEYERTMRCAS